MSAKYTFTTKAKFANFVNNTFSHNEAVIIGQIFNSLQAKFNDDQIIAHNICVLAIDQREPLYMIAEIIENQFAAV
jgi:hypothetical protein